MARFMPLQAMVRPGVDFKVYESDPGTDAWSEKATADQPVQYRRGGFKQQNLSIGGQDKTTGSPLTTVEEYDPEPAA